MSGGHRCPGGAQDAVMQPSVPRAGRGAWLIGTAAGFGSLCLNRSAGWRVTGGFGPPGHGDWQRRGRCRANTTTAHSPAAEPPSCSSALSCVVEVLELDAGILGGEPPVDPTTGPAARAACHAKRRSGHCPASEASSIPAMFNQLPWWACSAAPADRLPAWPRPAGTPHPARRACGC